MTDIALTDTDPQPGRTGQHPPYQERRLAGHRRMNGAEVRVLREALGLSPKWVAARLGLASDRHLRAVEAGEAPASVRMVALLHELEARAEAEVEEALATVFEEAGVDEYDEDALEQLDEADWPTIEVPRLDLDGDEFPAGWYRAIAARVRWELGARCWVEWGVE